jgi:hypothetical protein
MLHARLNCSPSSCDEAIRINIIDEMGMKNYGPTFSITRIVVKRDFTSALIGP